MRTKDIAVMILLFWLLRKRGDSEVHLTITEPGFEGTEVQDAY